MVNAALLNYVRQQLAAGHDAEKIRESLIAYGYPVRAIDEVLEYNMQAGIVQPAAAQRQQGIEQIVQKHEGVFAPAKPAVPAEKYDIVSLLRMWFLSLSMPSDIFREAKDRVSFAGAVMNVAAPAVLGGLIGGFIVLIRYFMNQSAGYAGTNIFGIGGLFTQVGTIERLFITPIEAILVWISITTAIYLFSAFIGGDGNFEEFSYYTSIAYAPIILFVGFLQILVPSCIVFFSYIVFGVLGIYPTVTAIKQVHKMDTLKAIIALAIPIAIVVALLLPIILQFQSVFKAICA